MRNKRALCAASVGYDTSTFFKHKDVLLGALVHICWRAPGIAPSLPAIMRSC